LYFLFLSAVGYVVDVVGAEVDLLVILVDVATGGVGDAVHGT
jgi:hypothetical protein